MRPALRSVESTRAGEALAVDYGGERVLLDPAGIAFFPAASMLVVADLHLEKGSSFARRRMFLPPYDTPATLARLAALIAKYEPRCVVSLGDGFHDDAACERLSPETVAAIEALAAGRTMIWVTGNHDPSPPVNVPGDSVDTLATGQVTFRHIAERGCATCEVSGHYHPAAILRGRGKAVRRSCFASDGVRLILPAFGVYAGGLNVRDRAFDGLFDLGAFRAYMQGTDRLFPIGWRDLIG
ncbi:MAG: ligase-associated DNA damage response endonuclease PdeM [Roseitalea porphyridii]|jgi:DNA ligase-associated metallophosphoesterase|uniref:ligase-associated DNA damage response endonuclease PdeM n=1 Tax=Roseitalea porphyridii TaxID=1852022 RepID=UPI0032EBA7A6